MRAGAKEDLHAARNQVRERHLVHPQAVILKWDVLTGSQQPAFVKIQPFIHDRKLDVDKVPHHQRVHQHPCQRQKIGQERPLAQKPGKNCQPGHGKKNFPGGKRIVLPAVQPQAKSTVPRPGVNRNYFLESFCKSLSTIISTSCLNETWGFQPSSWLALAGFEMSKSTSAGR